MKHKITKREIIAILITTLLLISGLLLGWQFEPAWFSRAGALIIVVGVIFAVTDLPVVLERRARSIARIANALIFRDLIKEFEENDKKTYTPEERRILSEYFEKLNSKHIYNEASAPKKLFLLVEATIICMGTIVNGFGEWTLHIIMYG